MKTVYYTIPRILLLFILLFNIQYQSICNDSITSKTIYKVGLPVIPGFMGIDEEGNVEGFSLELFVELAKQDSIKYEWVIGSWSDLFQKVKTGAIDVLPGTQVSVERKEYLDFMNVDIYRMWSELYTLDKTEFENLNELSNKKIGLVRGDNNGIGFDKYINDFNIQYQKVYYDSHVEVIEGLKNKEVFAFAGPSAKMLGGLIQDIRSTGLFYNPTAANFSFPKGKNDALIIILDNRLKQLKEESGSVYFELYQKYGFSSISTQVKIPKWLKWSLYLSLPFIILIVVFVIVLRREVNRKTVQLKQREINLKERAVYLREAMVAGKMGTWQILANTRYFIWSKEIFTIVKMVPKARVSFRDTWEHVHPDDRQLAMEVYAKCLAGKEGFDVEIRMKKPNGSIIYTKQVGVVIKDESNNPERILGIMQDITHQKAYELELLKAKNKAEESERLKSAFLANMSHEIRTPLNAIIGFTELMATTEQTPENRQKYSEVVLSQNELLLKLINDILDIAKIESGLIRLNIEDSLNVYKLVSNVYDSKITQKEEDIEYNFIPVTDRNISIRTDRLRLQQILYNFVVNAFKYTESGAITIGYYLVENNRICFFVRDTGVGIPEKLQESIFERFQQVDSLKQGAGLGLPISISLAKMLEGSIEVSSKEGEGSEFRLILPVA